MKRYGQACAIARALDVVGERWSLTALAMIGETDRAHALCQKLLSFAGPLLLYAEEIDTTRGQHLGNFPQAFTHLALIEAVSQLIAMEQREGFASVG
jgi:alpha,alpha-trehalase